MKSQPISINGLSALTGLDRRRLKSELAGLPAVKKEAGNKLYDLAAALRMLFEAERRKTDTSDIRDERLRWLRAKREREEIALGREREELIPLNDAIACLEEAALLAKGRFLRLPQIAADLEGKTAVEIGRRLDMEIHSILEEISRLDAAKISERVLAEVRKEQPQRKATP